VDYAIANFADAIFEMLRSFYHSNWMLGIKIFFGLYVLILFVDIVLLLILRGVDSDIRVGRKGMDMPTISKSKMQKRWSKVKKRLNSGNPSQYKVAIIEADAIVEEIIGGIGFKGANMGEKLEQVEFKHMDEHAETLKEAHLIRNKIVHEQNFVVDQRMAVAMITIYENFLKYLEFLD
jgi:hypothetical protein